MASSRARELAVKCIPAVIVGIVSGVLGPATIGNVIRSGETLGDLLGQQPV